MKLKNPPEMAGYYGGRRLQFGVNCFQNYAFYCLVANIRDIDGDVVFGCTV